MELTLTEAQDLAIIDLEVGDTTLSPAQYEVLRRVILETADFDYQSLIKFSPGAIQASAAAIAARTPCITDVAMVQAGITRNLQNTFANPVYCLANNLTGDTHDSIREKSMLQTLTKRHPEAIYIFGKSQESLSNLLDLTEERKIQPTAIIATPSGFTNASTIKQRLKDSLIPHICVEGNKGNSVVAVAIFNALISLTWQVYG
jgi:precorrin-8X/cobalt-precorrin-8 methylmutase